jgi:hypothetical protein
VLQAQSFEFKPILSKNQNKNNCPKQLKEISGSKGEN